MTVHTTPTDHDPADIEIVVRRFTENDCEVTAIVADLADAQQTLYGTVTRHGRLVGSYYCADRVRQSDWRIVTAFDPPTGPRRPPREPGLRRCRRHRADHRPHRPRQLRGRTAAPRGPCILRSEAIHLTSATYPCPPDALTHVNRRR